MSRQGGIDNIWSNVGQSDDIYVIKFFNEKKEELPTSRNLFSQYVLGSQKDIVEKNKTQEIRFSSRDNFLEEIRTIV
ncbi:MAG: hypothetical protein WC682_00065 [Parcubacteria group bacterium]